MTASNTISESDFLSLYAGQSPEVGAAASRVYLAAAEAGDKKLVMAHAQSDAAKNLMVAAKEAVSSYEGLRNNTNTSNTALQQAMVAGTVTQGNLTAAMAQLMVLSGVPGVRERVRTGDSAARRTGPICGSRATGSDYV